MLLSKAICGVGKSFDGSVDLIVVLFPFTLLLLLFIVVVVFRDLNVVGTWDGILARACKKATLQFYDHFLSISRFELPFANSFFSFDFKTEFTLKFIGLTVSLCLFV